MEVNQSQRRQRQTDGTIYSISVLQHLVLAVLSFLMIIRLLYVPE